MTDASDAMAGLKESAVSREVFNAVAAGGIQDLLIGAMQVAGESVLAEVDESETRWAQKEDLREEQEREKEASRAKEREKAMHLQFF